MVLFTDLIGSTGWKRDLGDRDYTAHLRRPLDRLFRDLLAGFPEAVERDNAGDGFLATFPAPSAAARFALAFHAALAGFDWAVPVRGTAAPRPPGSASTPARWSSSTTRRGGR